MRLFATAIFLAASISIPAVGQKNDTERVSITIERLSPTTVGYEVTVKIENAGTQPVSLALSHTTHPTFQSLGIQQWDRNLGWQSVRPCLDVPPDTTRTLAPGESFEDVVPIGDTSHGWVSTVCRSNTEHLRGKIRAVLCVYGSEQQFKNRMKISVSCKLVASPAFQLPEPLHLAHLGQGPTKIVRPVYPDAAKKAGIQGTVLLDVVIGENGNVTDVTVIKGPNALAEAAVIAVRQWHYEPHLLNGKAVRVEGRVTVNFVLPRGSLSSKKQGKVRGQIVGDRSP